MEGNLAGPLYALLDQPAGSAAFLLLLTIASLPPIGENKKPGRAVLSDGPQHLSQMPGPAVDKKGHGNLGSGCGIFAFRKRYHVFRIMR